MTSKAAMRELMKTTEFQNYGLHPHLHFDGGKQTEFEYCKQKVSVNIVNISPRLTFDHSL